MANCFKWTLLAWARSDKFLQFFGFTMLIQKTLNRTHAISGKVSTKLVESMAKAMRASGFNVKYPVEVIERRGEFYILDGHHRTAVARQTSTNVTFKANGQFGRAKGKPEKYR